MRVSIESGTRRGIAPEIEILVTTKGTFRSKPGSKVELKVLSEKDEVDGAVSGAISRKDGS